MAIKFCEKTQSWVVSVCKRHPLTRMPVTMRRSGFKSKAEASRERDNLLIEINTRLTSVVCPTWEAVVESCLTNMTQRGYTRHTVHCYGCSLKAHTYPLWKNKRIDEIHAQDIRELINLRLADKAPSHRQNVVKYVRQVFCYAVDTGYLKANPTPQFKFRKLEKMQGVLTVAHAKLLLEKAREFAIDWYPHWTMALYTGLRNGELYALEWENVNLETRQILVNSSWNNKDGFKSTKSGDERIIEIAPDLVFVLKELKLKSGGSPFVLPRSHAWDKGMQAKELKLFLKGLGLPAVRFHDLRASWATMMLSKGTPALKVMQMGGWRDLKTMQIYIRKAGVDIKGITDDFRIHNPALALGRVFELRGV